MKNKAIKGCEPRNIKKLGSDAQLSQINSYYRNQLYLPKELNKQRANSSNIKVKSLLNNSAMNARTTYYQMQYMKKNKIKAIPLKISTAGKSQILSPANKKWKKMQDWVNSSAGGVPTSGRLPASVKKPKK